MFSYSNTPSTCGNYQYTVNEIKDNVMADLSYDELVNEIHSSTQQGHTMESVHVDDPFADAVEVDSFEDVVLDEEVLAKQEQDLYLPQGLYKWFENKCTVTTKYNIEDKKSTDLQKDKGRYIISASGIVQPVEGTRKGKFFFTVSPDDRMLKDQNGKDLDEKDGFSRNWASLLNFYFKRMESKPKSTGVIKKFLEDSQYFMYITQSKKNGQNFLGSFRELG